MIEAPGDIADAIDQGQQWFGLLRRQGPATVANAFVDSSYAAGFPVANYYVGAELTATIPDGRKGIDHGPDVAAGVGKYIKRMCVIPPNNIGIGNFLLHDLVMFYPFIDGDGGQQDLINDVPIPRYGGVGCKIMAVSQGAGTGVTNYRITYTNSDGVSGRELTTSFNLAGTAGQVVSHVPAGTASQYPAGAYVSLLPGDKGIRSIERVEPLSATGGLHAICIVKPLGSVGMVEATNAPCERDFAIEDADVKQFENGAFLAMLIHATSAATPAAYVAEVETIWK
jgi:hypothetical protein